MVGRERQFDIVEALLDQIEADRTNSPPRSLATANTPKAVARLTELLIPALAFEAPPKAVRIKDRTVTAFANGFDRFPPSRRLEDIGRNAKAVFGVARHVTTTAPTARHPVLGNLHRRAGPRSLGLVHWRHPNGDG